MDSGGFTRKMGTRARGVHEISQVEVQSKVRRELKAKPGLKPKPKMKNATEGGREPG